MGIEARGREYTRQLYREEPMRKMRKRYPQRALVNCEAPRDENGELIEAVFRAEVRPTI